MNARRRAARRIVLACSGGLNASVAIRWLLGSLDGAEVVTVTLDLGQEGELEEVRDRALATGAARAHVIDAREEFARDYIVRALKADALDDDRLPLVTALAAPLVAKTLVDIAGIEQADAVAHAAGDAAAAARLETAVRALAPALTVLAPALEWQMSRMQTIEYAQAHRIAVAATMDAPHGVDGNLWGRSVAGDAIDAWHEPPESLFTLTRPAPQCPGEPAYAEISFDRGVPVALNGVSMPLTDVIPALTMLAGSHGVGRLDAAAGRAREVGEAPAAVVLHAAHAELQKLTTSRPALKFSRRVSREYADVVESGAWFSPLREALDAYVDKIQERVSGDVRVKLYKGDARIVGRKPAEPRAASKRLRVVASTPH